MFNDKGKQIEDEQADGVQSVCGEAKKGEEVVSIGSRKAKPRLRGMQQSCKVSVPSFEGIVLTGCGAAAGASVAIISEMPSKARCSRSLSLSKLVDDQVWVHAGYVWPVFEE